MLASSASSLSSRTQKDFSVHISFYSHPTINHSLTMGCTSSRQHRIDDSIHVLLKHARKDHGPKTFVERSDYPNLKPMRADSIGQLSCTGTANIVISEDDCSWDCDAAAAACEPVRQRNQRQLPPMSSLDAERHLI
jgi:hypothetical protein